jgi:2-polyprenyl-6-hydroxyphenyl methylase/3-demethylubiquinone-9 3-methyltransferase
VGDDERWRVLQASILDADEMQRLGTYDVVYSWGVLHHTGNMAVALQRAATLVRPNGWLFMAIYNDQGWLSRYWHYIKRTWVTLPWMRGPILLLHAPYLLGFRWLVRFVAGRGRLERGMRLWHDTLDWLGGYPFEVARPEAIMDSLRERGFRLTKLRTCGRRHGCNEFVFQREAHTHAQ